ncbi:MAG: galactokinase [Deltaproteobacteria bacterium]|nr:galactokinase [Deltaproteobacteria bacterium]MBW1816263.1 galactokinase [Deltaproteobacteria bacterium]
MASIRKLLEKETISASAPSRVDSGGTWDIKGMALPLEGIGPVTVNIALSLRTRVSLRPFDKGWIKISSEGFDSSEAFPAGQAPFDSDFGLYFAAVSHFGFNGLEVAIHSQSPVKSALGGSSTALVALVKALGKAAVRLGGKALVKHRIVSLAYRLEDGIGGGFCGIQDQAAAAYGGVNLWEWTYGKAGIPFKRTPLLDRRGQKALSNRLLVAYSGISHASLPTNRKWIRDFFSGSTRQAWVEINKKVARFAEAVRQHRWSTAAGLLREELALRKTITPEALIPIAERLIHQAEEAGCGSRFAGAGAGGSLWAIGESRDIDELRGQWTETLGPVDGAGILDCGVDSVGVK